MRRRDFITLLSGTAAAWPLAARAQQRPVIGYLSSGVQGLFTDRVSVFRQGLAEYGYIEGRNVAIEYRWAAGHYDRLHELAADLVRRQVNVIVTADSVVTAQAAKTATATIPIVFGIGADPVELGLVASLNHPGGNLTGATRLSTELEPKRLELLHDLVPAAHTFALLINPSNPGAQVVTNAVQAAARTLGLELLVLQASTERDLGAAFASMASQRAQGIVISPDSFFVQQSPRLAALALEKALPAIFQYREFAAAGGLIGYAGNRTESYRLVGLYTGRILKGEKAADLPVQRATTVELFINLKTARLLGISVPLPVLVRADGVIE
jgi:putative tryptophan/tyrosine transport system substrate-binding protein